MKLNPNNCTFGVTVEKFLGFMVSQRDIEVNSEKDHGGCEMLWSLDPADKHV